MIIYIILIILTTTVNMFYLAKALMTDGRIDVRGAASSGLATGSFVIASALQMNSYSNGLVLQFLETCGIVFLIISVLPGEKMMPLHTVASVAFGTIVGSFIVNFFI